MKIKFTIILFLALSIIFGNGYSEGLKNSDFKKVDASLAMLIKHPETSGLISTISLAKKPSPKWINVLIKSTLSRQELNEMGVRVFAQFNDIFTAAIQIDNLERVVPDPGIHFVQLAKTVAIKNDVSVPEIHVPDVWNQYYAKGKGVLIGVIDTGIDWQHEDFQNPDGTTRIKAILDFSNPGDVDGDNVLDGDGPFGGTLYTESEINSALQGGTSLNTDDVVGLGTHVAGTAAGNGRATGNGVSAETYVGVAPEASLIIVKATRQQGSKNFVETDYINAIKFIDSLATVYNMPYVANLSLGVNQGPHDGTDLAEQVIDQIVGSGIRGKAVVVSAGNEGNQAIHASGTFPNSASYTSMEVTFSIPSYTPNSGNQDDYVIIDGWYDAAYSYRLKIQTPGNHIYGWVSHNNEMGRDTDEGAIYVSNALGGPSNLNGDNQIEIQIYDFNKNKPPASGTWKIIIEGKGGRFDFWIAGSSMNAEFTSSVDHTMIVGTPGTAFNAITVGSYTSKNRWTDLDNNSLYIPGLVKGASSSFSSSGPTRDGRVKPEICAPGELITASYSQYAPPSGQYSMFKSSNTAYPNAYIARDGKHALSQGTSFAAPHVAGAVALMFQINANLDAIQVRDAIIASAFRDQFVKTTPNDKWGYGKLRVLEAVQQAEQLFSNQNIQLSIFQNPAFTQYVDLFLISKSALTSPPTVTITLPNQQTSSISMTQLEPTLYKGEFELSGEGIATITVSATVQGGSTITFYKNFYVKLLKASSGGVLADNAININLPANAFVTDTYFMIMNEKIDKADENLLQLSDLFRISPDEIVFSQPVTISFDISQMQLNGKSPDNLVIYRVEPGELIPLATTIDLSQQKASATIIRTGSFALFYDESRVASQVPEKFQLYQNYPNPFNSSTHIKYFLPEQAHVKITIFDLQGRVVSELFNSTQQGGYHQIRWNGQDSENRDVASGVYLVRVKADHAIQSKKILLLK